MTITGLVGKLSDKTKKYIRITTLVIAGLFVVYSLVGLLILPSVARNIIEKKLEARTGRDVTIDSIRLNPYLFTARIRGFSISERNSGHTFASFDDLYANLQIMPLFKKHIALKQVVFDNPYGSIIRNRDGSFNFTDLIPRPKAEPVQEEEPSEYVLDVYTLKLRGGVFKFSDTFDSGPEEVVGANSINLDITGFSTARDTNSPLKLEASIGGGNLSVDGEITPVPVRANLHIGLNSLQLSSAEPYIRSYIDLFVGGGALSVDGNAIYPVGETGLDFKGRANITDMSLTNGKTGEYLLVFQSLDMEGLDALTSPLKLKVDGVALTDFYTRFGITEDGKLNISELMVKAGTEKNVMEASAQPSGDEEASTPTEEPSETEDKAVEVKQERSRMLALPSSISIGTITLQGGTVEFSDHFIEPNYDANLINVSGRISGIDVLAYDTEKDAGEVDLVANLDGYAPIEISGRFNPYEDKFFLDLKAKFRNVELSPLNPYSVRYAGYKIAKGKLFLDLRYQIRKRKLDAKNELMLDQFTFGERVESEKALKLPVKLAVALLKDRDGRITLDFPVTGSLDEPEFSIWGVVKKIFMNLLKKIVTSPFAFLGQLFGAGPELAYVEFQPGVSSLSPDMMSRLDVLVKALYERPQLELDIMGHVDMERDRDGLRQMALNEMLLRQMIIGLAAKGKSTEGASISTLSAEERDRYIVAIFNNSNFPKPRTREGLAKALSTNEMENLIITNISISDNELRALAIARGKNVRDYMLKSGEIEPERVFTLEPKSLAPEPKDGASNSRVDFSLQ